MPSNRTLGDAQDFGHFLHGHATEEPQLDNQGSLLVDLGQCIERFVNCQDVFITGPYRVGDAGPGDMSVPESEGD